jgi:cell division FtsZ-interacting protein ZapD
MTTRKSIARQGHTPHLRGERVKDEVYRQMYRLEEGRPGAAMCLALALLHAWLDADSKPESSEERDWLKKISPICFEMIETSLQAAGTMSPVALWPPV